MVWRLEAYQYDCADRVLHVPAKQILEEGNFTLYDKLKMEKQAESMNSYLRFSTTIL